nr:conserved oligomeric golgi complex subunit 3 [Quercus suber]
MGREFSGVGSSMKFLMLWVRHVRCTSLPSKDGDDAVSRYIVEMEEKECIVTSCNHFDFFVLSESRRPSREVPEANLSEMDDTWMHTFAASSSSAPAKDLPFIHRQRRATLLQQPAEDKADVAVDAISEAATTTNATAHPPDTANPWSGPPRATLARRAQSYSDFYEAATAFSRKEQAWKSSHRELEDNAPPGNAELDFDDEFAACEAGLLEESHAKYQTYYEQLQLTESHLASLLSSTTSTLALLSTLSHSFKAVESQTDAFRRQCEALLAEQKRLTGVADGVTENVRYYAYLEPATRRLNAPGAASLVKGSDFPEMLHNLDNCLAYMETHPKHSEAATYRSRYRLLLTRALTLIRHHFTKSLADIAADITRRTQGEHLKESTHAALLYAKFRVPAPELKELGLEIQKRAVPTPDDVDAGREPEYASLLRELYQSYSATRGRLILPLVSRKMAELAASLDHADVLAFATSSLGFMRGICLDEHELWFEWFQSEGALAEFLESLMEPVYDYLRPKTIHETKLETLCELCAAIQARYLAVDSEDDEDGAPSVLMSPPPSARRPYGRKLDFPALVQPALEDAQTRLVFLALAVLRDGIEGYKAKPEDLEWPKQTPKAGANGVQKGPVLSGTRTSVPATPVAKSQLEADVDEGASVLSKHLTADDRRAAMQTWYPTLRKAIWLLRRIYRLVNSTVFDDLAHRVVHSTIHSLLLASQQLGKHQPPTDAQLFLLAHLLHLKQQIVAFDIEFVPPEVEFDFSAVTNTFHELRDRGSLWNPASWVRLLAGGALLPKEEEEEDNGKGTDEDEHEDEGDGGARKGSSGE